MLISYPASGLFLGECELSNISILYKNKTNVSLKLELYKDFQVPEREDFIASAAKHKFSANSSSAVNNLDHLVIDF